MRTRFVGALVAACVIALLIPFLDPCRWCREWWCFGCQ